MLFPTISGKHERGTRLVIDDTHDPDRLPVIRWAGAGDPSALLDPDPLALLGPRAGTPALIEHARGTYERPGLRGHRLAAQPGVDARDLAGRAWTTLFRPTTVDHTADRYVVDATDPSAALALRTEIEALPGGALRGRHTLTNTGATPYLLDGLEFSLPLPAHAQEILDFTGRHERERTPQRHPIVDGLWARESRKGRPGLDGTGALVAGTVGFGFATGELLAVSVAHSGNSVIAIHRSAAAPPTVSAGELLNPGEVVLRPGDSYTTPWIVAAASTDGLDTAAQTLHTWQRSLPAHPREQLITLNVWEAVYFNHDLDRLRHLADLAAQVGVERFVLDDGWFYGRRDDTAGLGDWWPDPATWPQGLDTLINHVHNRGMQFGLWFEPEMVNPDSDLYRAHPDWILSAPDRTPLPHRNQQVLDLTNPHAWQHVHDHVHAVLTEYGIDYVKWDHNRDLLEAGSAMHDGAPAAHAQTQAYYALLDELRHRHPNVHWESCAAGGGRIDLAVVERVQRFWPSDGTDALTRQTIQRWTGQYIAPEYLGAHISAPTSHQTGRTLSLDFRAATAFFLAFGIEWDLTTASAQDLDALAGWCALHKLYRPLLHTGNAIRIDTGDPAVTAHAVIDTDATQAIICHLQLDESTHNRGCTLRVPQLDPHASYAAAWIGPINQLPLSMSPPLHPDGPTAGAPASGSQLVTIGLWIPRRPPHTAQLIHLQRIRDDFTQPR